MVLVLYRVGRDGVGSRESLRVVSVFLICFAVIFLAYTGALLWLSLLVELYLLRGQHPCFVEVEQAITT